MSKLIVNDPRLQVAIRERKALEAEAAYRRFSLLETGASAPLPGPAPDETAAARFKLIELD
jgi:hypothetical protein